MVDQPSSSLYLLVLGAYILVILILGFFANRKVRTVEDYLVGGRRLPYLLAVPTIVATWYGAGFCMGVSGLVYSDGVHAVLADPFGATLGFIICGLFFAARFRRMNLFTVADVLGRAYGKKMEVCASVLMMPFYIGTLAAQMVALGYLLHLFGGIEASTAIIAASILIVVYTMAGGIWAVSFTDFVQMTVLLGGLALLLPYVYDALQAPGAISLIQQEFSNLLPGNHPSASWTSYLGQILITGFGAVMGQDITQRCLAAKSESVARWSVLTAGVFYLLLGLIPISIGLAGRSLLPDLTSPETLILDLATKHLSPALLLIFAVGLILALMSTADTYLLAGTSILTLNVVLPLTWAKSDRSRLKLLRLCTFAMALLACILASCGFNIFQLAVHSGAMLFVAIFTPVTMVLYWKRASATAAWVSMACGLGGWLLFLLVGFGVTGLTGDEVLYGAATVGGLASFSSYIVVALSGSKVAVSEPEPVQCVQNSAA